MKHFLITLFALSMALTTPAEAKATQTRKGPTVSRGAVLIGGALHGRGMIGHASWYGPGFHGRRTANGERFNQWAMTAAHKTLPFGTLVRVTNTRNNRMCYVRINDRGPFIAGRHIDLSAAAARAVGISGVGRVRLDIINR